MKRKVLFIMTSLDGGGAEKVLVTMLKNFDYAKFDVSLALTTYSGIYLNEVPDKVHIIPIYSHPGTLIERVGFWLYAKFRISFFEKMSARKAIKEHYDTIVSFMQGRALKFHMYLQDRASKNVSWVHCDMYARRTSVGPVLSAADEKKGYEAMDEVVFVSKEAQKQFTKLGYAIKKSAVVYNPIPIAEIQKYKSADVFSNTEQCPLRGDIPVMIVLCGSLSPVKAFDRIVRVADRLRNDGLDFQISIIGEGAERGRLEAMIKAADLERVVRLLGFKRPPYAEMAKGDIFVSCSQTEAYPLNVCEALCLGLPVVATECAGNSEVLGYGKYGKLVPQNEDELYSAIREMVMNKALREEYAEKARQGAAQLDMEKVVSQIYGILS